MRELVEGVDIEDVNLVKRLKVEVVFVVLFYVVRVWDYWNKFGVFKLMVVFMVDQSEFLFRMLCRKYGVMVVYLFMLYF